MSVVVEFSHTSVEIVNIIKSFSIFIPHSNIVHRVHKWEILISIVHITLWTHFYFPFPKQDEDVLPFLCNVPDLPTS